ncbi:hypothetical protein GJ744_005984 [Endocarpon pusillum]|uniref:Heterokaryon incompatibility domain-containing protein n=1 Tax=Endocarpon pusillum TaxID=364733 RepID=A0A8H7DZC8_9EURO|nr:hypothetical protein GJ744_005984 [Endocarpon pusillum]
MESIFSAAYCRIAATAAVNLNTGFLKRDISTKYVYVQDASGKFYISTDIDDFDNDVGKAQLDTRAWVMQEEVLARRTIHFSAAQTYWECGEGVYCENLTMLESPYRGKYFTLDPKFPVRLLQSGIVRTLSCITFIFQNYSNRKLTYPTDRCVAISGLVGRMASALKCEHRYGILGRYLHRNLLWQASNGKLEEIAYDCHVPSWSWMAYSGGIQFIDIPLGEVEWIDHLRFDEECDCDHAIIANLAKFRNCTMKLHGEQYTISDQDGRERGWIRYDVKDGEELCKGQCIVLGRMMESHTERYYLVVVRSTRVDGEYNRIGVGIIDSCCVLREGIEVRVV